jgi:nicotinamide-nucleotide amidase
VSTVGGSPTSTRAPTPTPERGQAAQAIALLLERGLHLATAESLTGGGVCAALTAVPGASRVVRGAVVAYATDLKESVLGVDPSLLATGGAVQAEVARQMALGVCRVLGCEVGLATTGVAGPDPQDGRPVGTVFVAVAAGERVEVRGLALEGDREQIRARTTDAVLALLTALVSEDRHDGGQEDLSTPRR